MGAGTRFRIQEVMVPAPGKIEILVVVSRGCYSPVAHGQGGHDSIRVVRRPDADIPGIPILRNTHGVEIATQIHQSVLDAPGAESLHSTINTVALSDAAQVDAHVLLVEEHHIPTTTLPELQGLEEATLGIPMNFPGFRRLGPVSEIPEGDSLAEAWVKGALCDLGPPKSRLQDT